VEILSVVEHAVKTSADANAADKILIPDQNILRQTAASSKKADPCPKTIFPGGLRPRAQT
jgi:hypothetical protein